jgi:AcrR family transcriptional regulator
MPSGEFGHAYAGIVERLRARRLEIDEAIFVRVSDQWFDQAGSKDPEYVAGLRAAGVAALDYALVGIERSGESLEPVPVAALEQARRAARVGVGLDTVLRRYLAGYAVLEGFVMQEAEHDELLGQGSALRDLLGIISTLVDRLITAVSRAYGEETEQAGHPALPRNNAPTKEGSDRVGLFVSDVYGVSSGLVVETNNECTSRRDRILEAIVKVAAERGFANTSVKLVTARAGVSTSTFYEEFEDLQECFVAVLDLALERAGGLIAQAFAREKCWQDGVLGALASLLVYFDSEPALTRVWFVEALAAGSWALERREHIAGMLRSMMVEHWVARGDNPPDSVAAAGVMASVLGLIHTHLVTGWPEPLIELLGPLMGLVTSLYLEKQDVAREVERGAQLAREIQAGDPGWSPPVRQTELSPAPDVAMPATLANPRAHRARECLIFLADHPDSSNSAIANAIGIAHKSHISRLLSYLLDEGLAVKHSEGGAGVPNAWRLTLHGEEIARVLAGREDWLLSKRPGLRTAIVATRPPDFRLTGTSLSGE